MRHTREIPRNDLANDAEWLMEGVYELTFVGLDGLTVDLVGPSSIVSDCRNGEGNVHNLSPFKGLACGKIRDCQQRVSQIRLDNDQGNEPLSNASMAQRSSKRDSIMSASLLRSLPRWLEEE